tara:strand:- start:112 stop:915 length:804 start_codon:yes stop_codon:yes gene_type:complete
MIDRDHLLRLGRWISMLALLGVCISSLFNWTNVPWFIQLDKPVTGSFSAGPINQFFSVGQTLTTAANELSRVDLKIAYGGERDSVFAHVEVKSFPKGRSLRSGSVELVPGKAWYSFSFPRITVDESGGQVLVEVRSVPGRSLSDRDLVSVFYEHRDPYAGGRMYVRGMPARADWDLGFRMYKAVGLREALGSIKNWHLLGIEAPWVIGFGLASFFFGLCLWLRRCMNGQNPQVWTVVFVVLMLAAVALYVPEAIANPAISTVHVGLQ